MHLVKLCAYLALVSWASAAAVSTSAGSKSGSKETSAAAKTKSANSETQSSKAPATSTSGQGSGGSGGGSSSKTTGGSASQASATGSTGGSGGNGTTSSTGNPIKKGYVAFGDSYAAGIGTGTTEGSGCRQGEFSYPKQLASTVGGKKIDFQNLPCSGAKVGNVIEGGENSQIDKWTNPSNADIATLSIGGNDIGFYNILTACILRVGGWWAGDCDEEINKAKATLSGLDLSRDITQAIQQMIGKSGRDDFKIYLTGYPEFFNPDEPECDYSTFYVYGPSHDSFHHPNTVYLYKSLRVQLNSLVSDLNKQLANIADAINKLYPNNKRVWFVDPTAAFVGHRFCEKGVNEPIPSRLDTWLFLGSWPDNSLPGTTSASKDNDQELQALKAGNSSALPSPDAACKNNSTDWYDQMLCDIATAATNTTKVGNNSAPMPIDVLRSDLQAWQDKNYTAVEVPWYIPTRLAKTFHPRTLGQKAYKDEIMKIW